MITILYDKLKMPISLETLLNELDTSDVALVPVPSYDFMLNSGIIFSPVFTSLLEGLSSKKIQGSFESTKILSTLGFLPKKDLLDDFAVIIGMLMTIWLLRERELTYFYNLISRGLKIEYTITPLLDSPPNVMIETPTSTIDPVTMSRSKRPGDILNIRFYELNKNIAEATKNILENSKTILLYQLSPLSIVLITSIEKLKKMFQSFKGSIMYLLPKSLNPMDKKVLEKMKQEPSLMGLMDLSHDFVDGFIFNEKDTAIVKSSSEYETFLYPVNYSLATQDEVDAFVDSLFKILGYSKKSENKD